ncbi:glutamate synthase subunit beta [Galactobacter valiniphilus]|uniref:Glutamate synthase subunit beta n=1 Tax=Galactobacter valiniphilus TaxID=2676122 RepID=A0A399J915_9MICC|nr:glutamate synthase subunit beta [Galactobacter valiniphilus]RII41714.1 glutamate synthase subunit beta [Galactobacter valiniphilus]
MADPRGFLNTRERQTQARRPVPVRLLDFKDVYEKPDPRVVKAQAGRCMDCGVPFCHSGCPLGNLIPEFNDLVWRGRMEEAVDRLQATNNFPELTGRLCPAPCESSCVLGINQPAVTIKQVEVSIAEAALAGSGVEPQPPLRLTEHTIAVVGSGPAGLAAAQQLTRAGHTVAVFERDDKIGGLLRYGIPDYKLEKEILDARIAQMEAEGTRFRTGVSIGTDIGWDELRRRYDAVIVATGAPVGRELPLPGRELPGVHQAMEYLVQANRAVDGQEVPGQIDAKGKHVVILGGGDTGADCIGTAHRQGAASVTTLAIGKRPPSERPNSQPWPLHPALFEVASAHEEGGERTYLASTVEFVGEDGVLTGLKVAETEYTPEGRLPKAGTERIIQADLVLLALGFTGAETEQAGEQLALEEPQRGLFVRDAQFATAPGVFVAGDAGRGASLIVWAIAEGRSAAAAVQRFLGGEALPDPVRPTDRGFSLA